MPQHSISIVAPVFNAEKSLDILYKRVVDVMEKVTATFELILVEDNGRDNSWAVIERLSNADKRVKGLKLSRNYGQHNALLCGIRMAQYELTVTIDDDLQNPPEEIPLLVSKIDEGFDVVYGTPKAEKHGILRDLASQITKMVLQGAMGADTARMVSAFRVFRTSLRNAFANYEGSFVSIDVLLTWGSTKFLALKVKHDVRQLGISNYTIGKLIIHSMNMMTGFSILPLQLASFTGFFFTLFGIGVFMYVLISFILFGTPVQGFPFLASIIAIFSGAQLFSLGIIGEYLARMHFRIMSKPSYNVLYKTPNIAE
jgi:glycosyltransferase involved in cell wall biosynthesis